MVIKKLEVKKVRIDIFYPKRDYTFYGAYPDDSEHDYQSFYCYEDSYLLPAEDWEDLTFKSGSFTLQYEDQYFNLRCINLDELLHFLFKGVKQIQNKQEFFQYFMLDRNSRRDCVLRIYYPKNGYISIARVSLNNKEGSEQRELLFKDLNHSDQCYFYYSLKEGVKITKTYFEVTLPVKAIVEEVIEKIILHARWKESSRQKKTPNISDFSKRLDPLLLRASNLTGVTLKSTEYYINKAKNRKSFLEEELKWLYIYNYNYEYEKNKFYYAFLKDIVRKIEDGGIYIHLKRFIEEQEKELFIDSLDKFEAYFIRLKLIDTIDDLFEDVESRQKRIFIEQKEKGYYRENRMITGRLKNHRITCFKRQYYHNPEGFRDSVLKRKLEKQLNKKIDNWMSFNNFLKY